MGLEVRRGPRRRLGAARELMEAGVFAVFANNDTSVLQFLPPLTLTDEEADEVVAIPPVRTLAMTA